VGNHRGKFKWGKYSRYSGNLKDYWTASWRIWDRHQAQYGRDYEFKLNEEWGLLDDELGGSLYDSKDELLACPYRHSSENVYVRYVTEWRRVG
jgi:hypothetical protein